MLCSNFIPHHRLSHLGVFPPLCIFYIPKTTPYFVVKRVDQRIEPPASKISFILFTLVNSFVSRLHIVFESDKLDGTDNDFRRRNGGSFLRVSSRPKQSISPISSTSLQLPSGSLEEGADGSELPSFFLRKIVCISECRRLGSLSKKVETSRDFEVESLAFIIVSL